MRGKIRAFLSVILVVFLSSACGQSVREMVSPKEHMPVAGKSKVVVVVPFADYTPSSTPYEYWRRNALVLEAVQDQLYEAGFVPVTEEDVVKYLIDKGVIVISEGISPEASALEEELQSSEWSEIMKEELEKSLYGSLAGERRKNYGRKQELVSLDKEGIRELAKAFGAEYVVRGRIVEYRSSEEDTFNPIKTGLLPFMFKIEQRTLLGVAEPYTYDTFETASTQEDSASGELFGLNYGPLSSLVWGEGKYLTGALGQEQGSVPKATVQVRMIVQDGETGEVVWLNRAEAKSMPRSVYAEQDPKLLFPPAIERAVTSLVRSFAAAYTEDLLMEIAEEEKAPPAPPEMVEEEVPEKEVEEEEVRVEPSAVEAKEAARRAEKSAEEAKKAAKSAKESAERAEKAEEGATKASVKSERVFEKIIEK